MPSVKMYALFGAIILVFLAYPLLTGPQKKVPFSDAMGKKAPDFSLQAIDGSTVRLGDYLGKTVILFFNEGSMCYPACWDQMAELGNDERFNTDGAVAFSIVTDKRSEWEKIVGEVPSISKAKILFDTNGAVSSAYGVMSLPSSMHPGSRPGHTYFIIDGQGTIRYALDDPQMGIRNEQLVSEMGKLG